MAQDLTRAEVAQIITGFVEGTGSHWDWDDFMCLSIKDPDLNMIQDIMGDFPVRFPPGLGEDGYCNEQGLNLLRRIRDELLKPDPDLKQFATHLA